MIVIVFGVSNIGLVQGISINDSSDHNMFHFRSAAAI